MAEHFVGPVMEKLIDACFEYVKDQVRWQTGMKEELENLRRIHPQIEAVVSTCSEVEIKDSALNKWYWQLRDAIDEADDILDEFEYSRLEIEVSKRRKISKVRSLMKSLKKRLIKISKRALKVDTSLKKLEKAVRNLCKVSDGVSTFLHLLENRRQEQQEEHLEMRQIRQKGSMPTNNLHLGRSKEMESVSQWLRNPDQTQITDTDTNDFYKNISVLSVVGHGGMGKTTLLQHVYSDGMTRGFNVKMWACVSTNFKADTVILDMLKSLKIQVSDDEEPLEAVQRRPQFLKQQESDKEPLEALQSRLKSEVMSKRFLLALDDIWEEDEGKWDEVKWENVLSPLRYGNLGSKILITTRQHSVASMFAKMINKGKETLTLTGLEECECLQLLNAHAFAGVENPGDEFTSIAGKMVEKLSGSPLAAKVIGKILNSYMDESYWRNVLNTNIGQVEPGQNHLIPILKLSYIYLPKFLKNCFAFCCMFPQDHQFDKDDLVRMWVSLDFIHSSDVQGETPESRGGKYFNILVQKSFFEKFDSDDKVHYKMHDLLHELAQTVSKQECFRALDHKQLSILPETIRHLSIATRHLKTFKDIGKFKNLRSLFLFGDLFGGDENVISKILKTSKSIRLLVFDGFSLFSYNLSEMVGCLIHLRYLKVEYGWSLQLPRSISHLYHLQFIMSRSFQKLEMDNISWKACNWLQGGIRNCSSSYIRNSPNLIHLTGRQELKLNENCQLITDELVIKDPSVLLMEPLRSRSSLRSLIIAKNNLLVSFSSEIEKWFLQQRSSLIKLAFYNLRSLQSLPSSLESLSSLDSLQVSSLASLQCLPSSLSTLSSLKSLELKNIPLLKSLPDLPSSLESLTLEALQCCLPSSLSTLLSLKSLELINSPLLKSLPDLPSSLESLTLVALQCCLPSSLSTFSSLNKLRLRNIPLLKSLPDLPSSLERLSLVELQCCLPSSLSTFSSLQSLELINIPLLKSLPDLPSSLKRLTLEALQCCLPSSLSTFSSLNHLKLKNIPLLKSLPDLPPSLWELHLEKLEYLDCLPSSLPTLMILWIIKVPRLLELPELPASTVLVIRHCRPQLMKRYEIFKRQRNLS